jgi:hypothetical protein
VALVPREMGIAIHEPSPAQIHVLEQVK